MEFLLLAAVQGVTEFLPVSSSGHLVMLESLLKVSGENFLFFNIVTHMGTLMATLAFYRRDLWELTQEGIRETFVYLKNLRGSLRNQPAQFPVLQFGTRVLLTTTVTGVIGILVKPWVKGFEHLGLLALFFFITAVILWTARSQKATEQPHLPGDSYGDKSRIRVHDLNISLKTALLIGLVQGLAVFPGISRSGITITMGILSGLGRREAMKYSILISIPLIAGAFVLEFSETLRVRDTGIGLSIYLSSLLISFVVGYLSLHLLWKVVKHNRIHLFTFYLIPLSLILGVYFLIAN